MSGAIQIIGVDHIPEIRPGDDLVRVIVNGMVESNTPPLDGDVLVVTQKIVSKAEGQLVDLTTIEPSALAMQWAERYEKDPRQVEVVLREATRIVRMERGDPDHRDPARLRLRQRRCRCLECQPGHCLPAAGGLRTARPRRFGRASSASSASRSA